MIIKNVVDEDVSNYRKISLFIGFPHCSFKCDKECEMKLCQNSSLSKAPNIEVSYDSLVNRYINNPITSAVVLGGLEPFDDFDDLLNLISEFRKATSDDIVIYTGYYADEIEDKLSLIKKYENIIVKFGRYVPNQEPHYDEVLGIKLASTNQYAERYN